MVISRIETISQLRQAGWTYEEIGGHFGITKQRIYQIYSEAQLDKPDLISTFKAASLFGIDPRTFQKIAARVGLQPVNQPKKPKRKNRLLWDSQVVLAISHHFTEHRYCNQCGFLIVGRTGRAEFCQTCIALKNKQRYKMFSPEQKAKHIVLVKAWMEKNPDKVREMSKKANRKYWSEHRVEINKARRQRYLRKKEEK